MSRIGKHIIVKYITLLVEKIWKTTFDAIIVVTPKILFRFIDNRFLKNINLSDYGFVN